MLLNDAENDSCKPWLPYKLLLTLQTSTISVLTGIAVHQWTLSDEGGDKGTSKQRAFTSEQASWPRTVARQKS